MSKETAKCNDQPAPERSCPDPAGSPNWAKCAVCGAIYENHAGSTRCCGSIAYVYDPQRDYGKHFPSPQELMENDREETPTNG